MNFKFNQKAKRLISGFVAAATAITMLPAIPAMAEDLWRYPYTLFAGSSAEGAITTTASNFGVNGNVATNGTISAAGNMNFNGTKTENAGLDMIYIFDKIDSKYFSGGDVEEHTEDYILDELNINISEPTEVLGEAELTGNININTALKAFKDVTLNGEVKNTNDSVIYSKYGDIVIDSTNVNLNGLVYAPFGSVEVKAMNLNLNNVVIIADSIVFDCPNVNANYSTNAADFVGTVSEPLNIPKDEWQYMKDENENGMPDFFENFENWSKLADSDGDGLPDSIEEYLGSDPNNIDTGGDGLNDYYEVFGMFTDPTKADTDDNGVNDGGEDFDEDGLTNLEEFDNKTNPYIADTDSDGLSDGDEVKTHGTDPLVADTDGDGLDDGDEIVLGTNPLIQDTDGDGIIDSKEKIQQTFTHKVKNDDCAVTEVIVDMECTGNINRTTSVESVINTDILCTDVVGLVGEPFEIETTSEFDKATLTFKIDKDKLGEIPFDNLLFLWYNEEEDEFIELETILNEENGTASIETTHFSKYMIVDKKAWFDAWAKEFNYNPASDPGIPGGAPTIRYNTVLAIDCSGSMDWNDPRSQRAEAAEKFIDHMNRDDKTAIVFFTGSAQLVAPMSNDGNVLKNTLKRIYSSGGTNFSNAINKAISAFDEKDINASYVNNRIILLSDGEDGGSRSALNRALETCDNEHKNIKIFTVGFGSASDSLMKDIAEATGGEYYKAFSADDLVDIFAEIGYSSDFDMTDTDGDELPDAVETAGIRLQNGKIIYLDPTDYDCDQDGLWDGEEINPKPFYSTKEDNGWLGIKKLLGINTVKGYYFKMTSNPMKVDSDYDGYEDYLEVYTYKSNPLSCDVKSINLLNSYPSINTSSYTTLDNGGFGGNQSWFYDENDESKNDKQSKHIRKGGCGVIASCDILLYLQKSKNKALTKVDTSKSSISYNDYDQFVRLYAQNYLTPLDVETPVLGAVTEENTKVDRPIFLTPWESKWYDFLDELSYDLSSSLANAAVNAATNGTGTWGCDPFNMLTELEKYCSDNGVNVTTDLCFASTLASQESLEERILESISNDIPAVMVIGLKGATKYRFAFDDVATDSVGEHFVVITGIHIDKITNKTTLTVSTWSKKAYIDLDNFLDNAGMFGCVAFVQNSF